MAIPVRNVTIKGVFAEDANTTIPAVPVSGISYRDTNTTAAEMEDGFPFKSIVDSSKFNEMLFEYSTISKMQEKYGFIPWSSLTDYETGSYCIGTDGLIYQAEQATGPSSTAINPVNDTGIYWSLKSFDGGFVVGDLKESLQTANHGNWFLCDGQAISRTAYAELFSLIGTTYGSGDGSTTFNLPDYTTIIHPTSTSVDVYGNGNTLGLIRGNGVTYALGEGIPGLTALGLGQYDYNAQIGTTGTAQWSANYLRMGVTDDKTKSGLTGAISSSVQMNYFIKVK